MRRRAGRVAAALLAGLLGVAAAAAQTTGGIEGVVRDPTGGALAGIDLLVTSRSLLGARTARTGHDGRFWLSALPPGVYSVTAARAGFRPVTKSTTVALDAKATVDFVLDPAMQEAVSVSGAEPPIDFTSTEGGTNYSSRVIETLPVDRNYADIVRSNPGVSTDNAGSQGRALALTIYGATSAENQFVIDGVNTTNIVRGIQGKTINNEFIEEVDVKTGGYTAEYGGALGGIVNVVTKSGGNEFHGGGFFYFDSAGTAAQQTFTSQDLVAAQMRWADYTRLDYGLDLGGYLVKDRVWFFGAYDRVTLDGNISRVEDAPLVSTSDRFPLNSVDNLYSGKLTWNPSPSTTVVGTVFADPTSSSGASATDPRQDQQFARFEDVAIVNPDPDTWSSARRVGGTDYALRATQLLGPRGVATFQASHHQDRNTLSAADKVRTIDLTCVGGTIDQPCDLPPSPNAVTGGFGIIDGQLDGNMSFRDLYRGDITLVAGNHELKAGGSYDYGGGDSTYSVSGGQEVQVLDEWGTRYYSHAFISRSLTDKTVTNAVDFHAKARLFGAYLQDSWRPTAGLTINAGLRWDAERLVNYAGKTVLSLDNEWQPRLGITWDPWKDGRTKLYAFAGRFYYALPTLGTARAFTDFTVIISYNFDPLALGQDPSVPNHSDFDVPFGSGPLGDPVDPGIRGIYQDELTVGAERMLDPTLTVGVKGTYRRLGNTIEDRCDPDPTQYDGYQCALINPGSSHPYAHGDFFSCNGLGDNDNCSSDPEKYYPVYGAPPSPPARRVYRGIELLARKSIGNTLWLQASYVYSSLRGNYDGGVNEALQDASPGFTIDFDWPPFWHNAYGRLYLDRPHHFRLDGSWVTPLQLSIGLQAFVASGPPTDKFGAYPNIYVVPRGSVGRMPTQWDANLTLSYPVAFGPAAVTLQAYVFNAFNNQIPTNRDNFWTSDGENQPVYDPNLPKTNDDYGKATSRQNPRSFRAAVRVSF